MKPSNNSKLYNSRLIFNVTMLFGDYEPLSSIPYIYMSCMANTRIDFATSGIRQEMLFEPGLHEQMANDIFAELATYLMKSSNNSPSHTAQSYISACSCVSSMSFGYAEPSYTIHINIYLS